MTEIDIQAHIMTALHHAEVKHPRWTTDAVHAVAILAEETGELIQAANDFQHAPSPTNRIRMRGEALQVGAMVFRFLTHLDEYEGNTGVHLTVEARGIPAE